MKEIFKKITRKCNNVLIKIIDYAKKRPFTAFVRFFFLFSLISFVIVCYDSWFSSRDLRYFVFFFTNSIVYSIICNIGFYLITTELPKQYRILSTILYLPSIFVSPFFTVHMLDPILTELIFPKYIYYVFTNYTYNGSLLLIALFLLSLYIYYHFNPWRKIKNDLWHDTFYGTKI